MASGRILIAALAAAFAVLFAVCAPCGAARAQALMADLSSHLIAINTGFTGTEVVLFGSTDGPGEVAVVVRGPASEVTVREKGRVAGIWVNRVSMDFEQVPSFYGVATSRPLGQLADDSVLARHAIGLDHLRLAPRHAAESGRTARFREALIRAKQEAGLYTVEQGQVLFLGERLFRTNVYFPANVPTGTYTVQVFLIRDGDVVSAQTTPLSVSKVGFSADISEFALHDSAFYGLSAIMVAVAAGWLAGTVFRKV